MNGIPCLTTWLAGGADKADNQWRLEPVDMEGKSVYDVVVDGNADAYVTYDGGYAFNGGFFITASAIDASDLSVSIIGNVLKSADVKVEGNTIKVTNVKTLATPVKQDLYNTSKGDGVIPPYRIPGITTTACAEWHAALPILHRLRLRSRGYPSELQRLPLQPAHRS